MEHDVKLIPLDRIVVGTRLRVLRDEQVAKLAESVRDGRLINPITVVEVDGGYRLVAGRHRLEAFRHLDLPEIPSHVLGVDEVGAELAEIDENLVRRELSVLEEAEHLARREEILAANGQRARAGDNQHTVQDAGGAALAPPATTATIAAQMRMSERTAQERMQIARDLAPEARDLLRGTAVADNRAALLDLARKASHGEQVDVARLIVEGQAATVWDARAAIDRANRRRRDHCRTCGKPSAELVERTCPTCTDQGRRADRAKRAGTTRAEDEKLRVKFTSLTNASERCVGVDATSMARAIGQKGARSARITIRELRAWLDDVEAALGAVAQPKARTAKAEAKAR